VSELRKKFKKREKLVVPLRNNSITINSHISFENVTVHSIDRLSKAKIVKDYNITFSIDMNDVSKSFSGQPYRLYEYSYKNITLQFELDDVDGFLVFDGKLIVLKVLDGIMLFSVNCHQTYGINFGEALKQIKETVKKEEIERNRKINRKFTF
jgi:hypothetical protein